MATFEDQSRMQTTGYSRILPVTALAVTLGGIVILSESFFSREPENEEQSFSTTGATTQKAEDSKSAIQVDAPVVERVTTLPNVPPSIPSQDPGLSLLENAMKQSTVLTLSLGLAQAAKDGRKGNYNTLFSNPFLISIVNPEKIPLSEQEKERIFKLYQSDLEQIEKLRAEAVIAQEKARERLTNAGQTEPTTKVVLESGGHTETMPLAKDGEELSIRTVNNENRVIRIRPGDAPEYDYARANLHSPTRTLLENIRLKVLELKKSKDN